MMAVVAAGCGNAANDSTAEVTVPPSSSPAAQSPVPRTAEPALEPAGINEQLDRMTVEDKIGQMVVIGLEGTSLKAKTRSMLDKYKIGGFILYKRNIDSAEQTLKLLNELKAANGSDIPLWLGVDEEGGKVSRLPKEFVKLPAPRDVGKTGNTEYAAGIGSAIGTALAALGFNMDFAPVLDIDSNPDNPVIGNRSFGRTPETVSEIGVAAMQGLQSQDVVAVVKHFPGHGDTSVDSHLDLPVEDRTIDELHSFELLPFKAAIENGADAIMVAHILLPQIDSRQPASLSNAIINRLLREDLGFDGVVMTDDMTMGGITKHRDIGEAAVEAVLAGNDILLVGHKEKLQTAVLDALRESVEDGTITEERLNQSVRRILELKAKYELEDSAEADPHVELVNKTIQEALDKGKQ